MPLKKLRENKVLSAKKELAVIEEKLLKLKNKKEQLLQGRSHLIEDSQSLNLHLAFSRVAANLVTTETTRLRALEREIIDVEFEVERQRNWVTHLGRELKIVEKLEEKKREEWALSLKMKEKRKTDQWVAERWGRDQNGKDALQGES